jgi:rhodanese-related sulfurtransferase
MSIKNISVAELHAMTLQGKGLVIIDVRTCAEFDRGHIPGAMNLHGDALKEHLRGLPVSITTVVVCQSGGRSQVACQTLKTEYPKLINVDGGTTAWIRAGLPIEMESNIMQQTSESQLRRQTHLVAGTMLITALSMGLSGHPAWFYLACLPAFGLMFDAITGICPMTLILKKAPWNSGVA